MFVFGFIPNTQTELSGIEALGKLRFEKELGKVVDATSNVIKPALQAFKEVTALPLKLMCGLMFAMFLDLSNKNINLFSNPVS